MSGHAAIEIALFACENGSCMTGRLNSESPESGHFFFGRDSRCGPVIGQGIFFIRYTINSSFTFLLIAVLLLSKISSWGEVLSSRNEEPQKKTGAWSPPSWRPSGPADGCETQRMQTDARRARAACHFVSLRALPKYTTRITRRVFDQTAHTYLVSI